MDQLQSKLDAVLAAARQEQASSMDSVHHRGHVLPVADAKVKLALAQAGESRVELEQAAVEDVASRGAVYSKLIRCAPGGRGAGEGWTGASGGGGGVEHPTPPHPSPPRAE